MIGCGLLVFAQMIYTDLQGRKGATGSHLIALIQNSIHCLDLKDLDFLQLSQWVSPV